MQLGGDNFYDQDGRTTKSIYDKFSMKVKAKVLYSVPGNHDVWVCGGSGCQDEYDQYGFGQMQFYGQDTMLGDSLFSFDINPSNAGDNDDFKNDPKNFITWNKIGSLGFIQFSGSGMTSSRDDENIKHFAKACNYFQNASVSSVFILGHYDSSSDRYDYALTVPDARDYISKLSGCDSLGDKLKYLDGHTHTNKIQSKGKYEPVGFMIGAHGMTQSNSPSQYGFLYIETEPLALWYFEERNKWHDNFDKILSCVKNSQKGIGDCTHLAIKWL